MHRSDRLEPCAVDECPVRSQSHVCTALTSHPWRAILGRHKNDACTEYMTSNIMHAWQLPICTAFQAGMHTRRSELTCNALGASRAVIDSHVTVERTGGRSLPRSSCALLITGGLESRHCLRPDRAEIRPRSECSAHRLNRRRRCRRRLLGARRCRLPGHTRWHRRLPS